METGSNWTRRLWLLRASQAAANTQSIHIKPSASLWQGPASATPPVAPALSAAASEANMNFMGLQSSRNFSLHWCPFDLHIQVSHSPVLFWYCLQCFLCLCHAVSGSLMFVSSHLIWLCVCVSPPTTNTAQLPTLEPCCSLAVAPATSEVLHCTTPEKKTKQKVKERRIEYYPRPLNWCHFGVFSLPSVCVEVTLLCCTRLSSANVR